MSHNPNSVSFILVLVFLCSSPFLSTSTESEVDDESTFSYIEGSKDGPENWGSIDPQWKLCGSGKSQSPVDLGRASNVFPEEQKLLRNYKPALAHIKNRGHDIKLEWTEDAGGINFNGISYKLIQCHWHIPSEHTVNGTRFDMEIHMVHESCDKKLAVIGIMYKLGGPDVLFSQLYDRVIGGLDRDVGIINPAYIAFDSTKYYNYNGSLTTPPCSQDVLWIVQHKVATVTRQHFAALRDSVHEEYKNARPTQELNQRPVWLYDYKKC